MYMATRGEGAPTVKVSLPLNADALKIALLLPGTVKADQRYHVMLLNQNGEVKDLEVVERDGQTLSIIMPQNDLKPGRYAIKLATLKPDGTEQPLNGSYYFTVE
jgi:methionine-rich copper-binding protein CopC